MNEKNDQNAAEPTKSTRQYKHTPKPIKRHISKIFAFLACLLLLVNISIPCFADSHTSYGYVEMQPSPLLPSSVTTEVKTANSEVFLATQTVQGSIFVADINEPQQFNGTTYNVIDSAYGSGTYPTAYATYYSPNYDYGYNTMQRISNGDSSLGSYGAFVSYYPTTFYARDFEDSAVFRPVFSSPDIVSGEPTRLLVSAKLVCDINGETKTYTTNFYAQIDGFSGANNEYCTYQFDLVYLLANMGVTFHQAPLNVHSFEMSLSPECKFDDFWEPVDSRFRWLDVRFNSYPVSDIPTDFNDSHIIYQQVVNSGSASSFVEFLTDTVGGFFGTTLFNFGYVNVTIGAIFSAFGAVAILVWLLKLFLGG